MEREKKGLFGKLLEFWKEKFSLGETDSIGFWNDTENFGNHIAEMGAVASLTQKEVKKAFWEETAESGREEMMQEEPVFIKEKAENRMLPEEMEEKVERRDSRLFTAEVFWNEKRKEEEEPDGRPEKVFLWESPEKDSTIRQIIPVAEDVKEEETPEEEQKQEIIWKPAPQREEQQTEPTIDIEKLMRQMTKKLWEERESCGRRLR